MRGGILPSVRSGNCADSVCTMFVEVWDVCGGYDRNEWVVFPRISTYCKYFDEIPDQFELILQI